MYKHQCIFVMIIKLKLLIIVLLYPFFVNSQVKLIHSLHKETNEEVNSSIELFFTTKLQPNRDGVFSFIIKTKNVKSKIPKGNVFFILPESAIVDYTGISMHYAKNPNDRATLNINNQKLGNDELNNLLKSIFSFWIGPLISLNDIAQSIDKIIKSDDAPQSFYLDLNEFDVVSLGWDLTPFTSVYNNLTKIQIDVPVKIKDNCKIGFYAFWSIINEYEGYQVSTFPLFNLKKK